VKNKKKVKKVLLFTTPAFTFKDNVDINPMPPLGLGYLGAVLENAGIEVKIVDCLMAGWNHRVEIEKDIIRVGLPFYQIEDIIRDYGPDMLGVNSMFTKQRDNAHKIYELAKKVDSNIITVAGGGHPTVLPELVLADRNVDFLVLGEGEDTTLELVRGIEAETDISRIDSIGYRENGHIKIIPKTRFIEDLDRLPMPARHLLNMEMYFGLKSSHGSRRKRRFSPIITSRGCPAGCTFCSAHRVWGRRFRPRSPENVIAEMKHIKEKYGIEEIVFEDDNVTLNVKRAERLFDMMIEERLGLVWDTPNGVAAFALNENIIDKMKASGCYKLNLALESGNQYVLDHIIKKPLKLERAKQLVKYAQNIGLDIGIFLIMGMPGETRQQIQDSFNLVKELGTYTPHISVATPYPGSELYEICRQNKYIPDDFTLDDLFIRSFCISTEDWSGKELEAIVRSGEKSLFLCQLKRHPARIFHLFIKALFTHPISLIRNSLNFAMVRS
jgi:magnesium-protoporphyrin IX monomethyl ester (oxidative) cyclase